MSARRVCAALRSQKGSVEKTELLFFGILSVCLACRHDDRCGFPFPDDGNVVLVDEIFRVYLVVLQQQAFVVNLLLRREVYALLPVETVSLQGKTVLYHFGDELEVDGVPQVVGILADKVLQHLQVHLTLRKAATVLRSHGFGEHAL